MAQEKAIEALRKERTPKQPDICKIYGGVCGYPIECCSECPKHDSNDNLRQIYDILCDYFKDTSILNDMTDFRKWLERIKWHIKKCDEYARKFDEIKNPCEEALEKIPSVQPARHKGKWIQSTEYETMRCSECKIVYTNSMFPRNFCPYCGAEMKED